MDKDLYIMARVVVPINVYDLFTQFARDKNAKVNIVKYIPADIIKIYEDNLPKIEDGFSSLNDAKVVQIDDSVFDKYNGNKEYYNITVNMYFSATTGKVVEVAFYEPSNSGILVN